MDGWVKFHRKILQNSLWLEPRKFSRAEAWIYLLLRANHKETIVYLGGDSYNLKPGQFITSQYKLAEVWGWNRETVKKFLDYLNRDRSASYRTSHKNTIITLLNWDIYQTNDCSKPATKQTSEPATNRQQNQQQTSTDNNDDNAKNEKKERGVFLPPTVREVKVFCLERKNQVDPEAFFNFYTSKGG